MPQRYVNLFKLHYKIGISFDSSKEMPIFACKKTVCERY